MINLFKSEYTFHLHFTKIGRYFFQTVLILFIILFSHYLVKKQTNLNSPMTTIKPVSFLMPSAQNVITDLYHIQFGLVDLIYMHCAKIHVYLMFLNEFNFIHTFLTLQSFVWVGIMGQCTISIIDILMLCIWNDQNFFNWETDYIIEKEPLVNKFISRQKDKGNFYCLFIHYLR